MLDMLNSNTWMVLTYAVVAALAAFTGIREQSAQASHRTLDLVPAFWFLTSTLFLTMAIAHACELGGAVADYARRGAYNDGWYDARSSLQVIAVGAVAVLWAIVTLLALWRIPERRRRYLPITIAITTLLCFSAIRLVSLHVVDTVLYRRNLQGVRVGVVVEFVLVAVAALVIDWGRRRAGRTRRLRRNLVEHCAS